MPDSTLLSPTVEIEAEILSSIHFVHDHLGIPLIPRLRVENHTAEPLPPGRLLITCEPGFAASLILPTSPLGIGQNAIWENVPLRLEGSFLASQSEAQKGKITIRLEPDGVSEVGADSASSPMKKVFSVSVLARNQWPGLGDLPELLAAYVTPNQPAIQELLFEMGRLLKKVTGRATIDGYQSGDTCRVYQMVEAAFAAVQARQINYVNPPVSYDEPGQKVRFAEEVWLSRQAACLDFTLLFASLLEAAGLHPLICLEKSHAYAACWLLDERAFDLAFTDDAQAVRKVADLQELCAIEATLAAQADASFPVAEKLGRAHLDNKEGKFQWALDVRRTRIRRVKPLPLEIKDGRIFVAPEPDDSARSGEPRLTSAEQLDIRFSVHGTEVARPLPEPEPAEQRIERWKTKLLDLSLRNRLLNLAVKRTVKLLPGSLAFLEDHLADAGEVHVLEREEDDPRDAERHTTSTGEELLKAQREADLASRKLRADEDRESLLGKLVKLERDAKIALDESGANTLFLALGILSWREHAGKSATTRYAPLLLLPVMLERRSVRSGFRLSRRDEETRVNVTLLEKLRREFAIEVPGVHPPPQDDAGVDVELVLRRFRAAVKDAPGFEVQEETFLGLFSFTKFLLWQDLSERLDDLKRNPVVRHLVEAWGKPFPAEGKPFRPEELDQRLPPRETFNVIEADSYQLAAMANAVGGQHFVLNGPPGTGKSQTIANMIAQCVACGKSVLFVAEKKTALEVVQRRLEKIGLGAFCLELHSNKSGKTAFIKQLREAVEHGGMTTPEEWERIASDLERRRDTLNGFVEALHRRCANGLSAYACYGTLIPIGGREGIPVELEFPDLVKHSVETRLGLRECIEIFAKRLAPFASTSHHPLAPLRATGFSFDWESEMREKLGFLLSRVEEMAARRQEAVEALKLGFIPTQMEAISDLAKVCQALLASFPLSPQILREPDWRRVVATVATLWPQIKSVREARQAPTGFQFDKLRALDEPTLRQQWEKAEHQFVLFGWMAHHKVKSALRLARNTPGALNNDEALDALTKLKTLVEAESALENVGTEVAVFVGTLWQGAETDEDAVTGALNEVAALRQALLTLAGSDASTAAQWREQIATLLESGRDWLAKGAAGHDILSSLITARSTLLEACEAVCKLGPVALEIEGDVDGLASLAGWASGLLDYRNDWQRWALLQAVRAEAMGSNLSPLVSALEDGKVNRSLAVDAFDQAYAWATLKHVLNREPILFNFFGSEHNDNLVRFREVDAQLVDLNRQVVVAKVAAHRPVGLHDERAIGEVATLRSEIAKQRKLKPVRRLLGEIPAILPRLKPCVLMSPLSVAQYLSVTHPLFDVVIFDEASQIPVCDAVGALARGKQTVVAGDPRQLPPPAFFQKTDDDDNEGASPGALMPPDQESILDECLAAQVPEHHLQWHYRSRRESLISFSNQNYYENRLLTFPAHETEERGVLFHPIAEGYYDRGNSRTNRAEAETVVAAVKDHLLNTKESLAVIMFNTEQMTLIENLLDQARNTDEAFDEVMRARTASDLEEPFKVRNLESIQGDERNVIFFSITYGPDRKGDVAHNFGPLNKAGGERRLNVAVTRAKQAVHVFSTLRAAQVDLRRSQATGVRHLKAYLEYAENGPSALLKTGNIPTETNYDSAFERFVTEKLRVKGWSVHTQVGCSAYRIDLAVVHPDKPGSYLAGVECDGATYHRAATARDRDRLRQAFLTSLGWKLLRVWSPDWFREAKVEVERLDMELKRLQAEWHTQPAPEVPSPQAAPELPTSMVTKITTTAPVASEPLSTSGQNMGPPSYRKVSLPHWAVSKDDFYAPIMQRNIREQIQQVLAVEAPIALDLLVIRIREAWGIKRAGARVYDTIKSALLDKVGSTESTGRVFLWVEKFEPRSFNTFRPSDPGEIPGDGIDNDGNGLMDDIHGWDFANDDNDPMDQRGHGTHVAGILGAVGNNGIGVAGVNWNVRMAALQFINAQDVGSTSDAIDAIYYAIRMGMRLTCNSWVVGVVAIGIHCLKERSRRRATMRGSSLSPDENGLLLRFRHLLAGQISSSARPGHFRLPKTFFDITIGQASFLESICFSAVKM